MKVQRLAPLLSLMLLLAGCYAPKGYVGIDILEPASVTFPNDVEHVAYLNRSPFSYNNMARANTRGLDARELRIIDTMACNALQAGFYDAIEDSRLSYLDSVTYLENRRRDTTNRFSNLTAVQHNRIFSTFPLDALITQDYYYFALDAANQYDYGGFFYRQIYTLHVEIGWKIYTSGDTIPLNSYRLRDTLFFENRSDLPSQGYIDPADAIRIGLYETAFSYGQRIIPLWKQVDRFIYKGRERSLRTAGEFTDNGDWENAREIWLANLDADDSELKARSAFNLAVYHEIEDDLESALKYLSIARESMDEDEIENYYEDMKVRLENKAELYRQMR